jgi:hypothetical protein
MDTNGKSRPADVTWLPTDDAELVTAVQRQADDLGQPFAAVDADHRKYYDGDMQQLDEIESQTLATISRLRQELRPEFVQPKIQAVAEEALKRLEPFEANRLSRLETERQRLQSQVPTEVPLTEVAENTAVMRDLYILNALGSDLLSDPLRLRVVYLDAVAAGNLHMIRAIERDPLGRGRRALTDQDLRRGRIARGLSASPDLQRKLDAYEVMIQRYRGRMASLRRHLQAEGWVASDPLIDMAGQPAAGEATP